MIIRPHVLLIWFEEIPQGDWFLELLRYARDKSPKTKIFLVKRNGVDMIYNRPVKVVWTQRGHRKTWSCFTFRRLLSRPRRRCSSFIFSFEKICDHYGTRIRTNKETIWRHWKKFQQFEIFNFQHRSKQSPWFMQWSYNQRASIPLSSNASFRVHSVWWFWLGMALRFILPAVISSVCVCVI